MSCSYQVPKCIWIALAFSYVVQGSYRTVFFEILPDPIIFGDSVVLRCYVSEKICDTIIRKAWGIGPSNSVICSNGESYRKNKYKMISNNISGNYDLEIFRFNEKDMENLYTYSCGAKTFSKRITPSDYLYYPSLFSASKVHIDRGIIRGSVKMENVFPIPNCTVISGEIVQKVVFYVPGGYFKWKYKEINAKYIINAVGKMCDNKVTIVCRLGQKTYEVARKINNNMHCKSNYIIPVLIVTGVIITIASMIWMIFHRYNCNNNSH
ncbi:Hypothetical predicted protein [Mytilus galloprovincialis]|uniref:Uncharacterized protein n=1 Tax=Mytilus galloprovincialis TaxID=29158 RepID=A0A8B6DYZ5_MYTGA|nr:Hypothetical predicted protein [Mytilus galloprovincialis]